MPLSSSPLKLLKLEDSEVLLKMSSPLEGSLVGEDGSLDVRFFGTILNTLKFTPLEIDLSLDWEWRMNTFCRHLNDNKDNLHL